MAKSAKAEVDVEVEATEENTAPEAPKAPRVTEVNPTDNCIEPKPEGKKGIVFNAGRSEEGGSIEALSTQMGCTTSNIRQHVAQCHTKLGYGYRIEGDNFKILGVTTVSWESQAAVKAEAAAAKKAEAAEAKADQAEAEAQDEPEGDDEGEFL